VSFQPERGVATLAAEDGWTFRPSAYEIDRMAADDGVPFRTVDILDTSVFWTRMHSVEEAPTEASDSSNTVLSTVQLTDGTTGRGRTMTLATLSSRDIDAVVTQINGSAEVILAPAVRVIADDPQVLEIAAGEKPAHRLPAPG